MMERIARNEAEFCGKVPLHQTNLLQPHGYLLIVDLALNILQAGENVSELFGADVSSVINRSLTDFIPGHDCDKLRLQLEHSAAQQDPLQLDFEKHSHLALIKRQKDYFIIEIEKKQLSTTTIQVNAVLQQLKNLLSRVESSFSIQEFCHAAIFEVKRISGFDKIMIYRFDENWNGDVIAEVKEEGMDTYLGLKFPASDIPRQARELYKTTAYRLIPDTKYEPVKLHPVINKISGGFTDLSASNLRSVALVHLEYLENMKVQASMSTRIMVDGKLWGLIACHHRKALFLDFDACTFFEVFSQVLSSRIAWIQDRYAYEQKVFLDSLQIRVIQAIMESQSFIEGLKKSREDLLKLFSAEGISVIVDRQFYNFGTVPMKNEIEDLVIWLRSNNIDQLYHQTSLSSEFEPALDYARIGSGVVVLPLHKEKGDYMIAFRPEAITRANWGGNPDEAVQFEADGRNYHPRSSFALWQQTVRYSSFPWEEQELVAMENFMKFTRSLLYQKNLLIKY
jgi:two-component system, chemotaxis family, sensor kinase Cph1